MEREEDGSIRLDMQFRYEIPSNQSQWGTEGTPAFAGDIQLEKDLLSAGSISWIWRFSFLGVRVWKRCSPYFQEILPAFAVLGELKISDLQELSSSRNLKSTLSSREVF